jgi:DNA-binding NtrC family response regulator
VKKGTLRADLYYRIQGITLAIPPLRERRADIEPLVTELTAQLSSKHRVRAPEFTRSAKAALRGYAWPGNIRELRNVVEQMCLLRPGRPVRAADLPAAIRASHGSRSERPSVEPAATLEVRLDQPLEETIDRIIEATVAREHGNRSLAAQRLGIGLRTVQRRLRGAPSGAAR